MKAMVLSDFAQLRAGMKTMLLLLVAIDIFMLAINGDAAMPVTMLCTMVPYLLFNTLATSDELTGWERMRATLPGGRRAAVLGRYASVLLLAVSVGVAAVAFNLAALAVISLVPGLSGMLDGLALNAETALDLVAYAVLGIAIAVMCCAVSMPVVFKQGMSGAARTVPLAAMLAFVFAIAFFDGEAANLSMLDALSPVLICGGFVLLAAAACAISIPLSLRLHAAREL